VILPDEQVLGRASLAVSDDGVRVVQRLKQLIERDAMEGHFLFGALAHVEVLYKDRSSSLSCHRTHPAPWSGSMLITAALLTHPDQYLARRQLRQNYGAPLDAGRWQPPGGSVPDSSAIGIGNGNPPAARAQPAIPGHDCGALLREEYWHLYPLRLALDRQN
jgi:hypothetical protein